MLTGKEPTSVLPVSGHGEPHKGATRRRFIAGAGSALGASLLGMNALPALGATLSRAPLHGRDMPMQRLSGGAAVLNTYKDTTAGLSPSTFTLVEGRDGIQRLAVGCTGLTNQLQIFNARTGAFEKSAYAVTSAQQGVQQLTYVPQQNAFVSVSSAGVHKVDPAMQSSLLGKLSGGSSTGYDPTVHSSGDVWVGTYGKDGKGTFARIDPSSGYVRMMAPIASEIDYVRCISIAGNMIWGGTGNINPRLVSMDMDRPGVYKHHTLPNIKSNSYVYWVRAWADAVVVSYKHSDGVTRTSIMDTATGKFTVLKAAAQGGFVSRHGSKLYYFATRYIKSHDLETGKAAIEYEGWSSTPLSGRLDTSGGQLRMRAVIRDADEYRLISINLGTQKTDLDVRVPIRPSAFKVQTIHSSSDGYLYAGGYQGDSISRIHKDTKAVRRSTKADPINQIESMADLDSRTMYVGSYEGADIVKYYRPTGATRSIARLGADGYQQSRPFGMVIASGKIVVGCVPAQGLQGGGLTVIDPSTERVIRHHPRICGDLSITGLYAKRNIVYGTTTVRAAYGAPDAEGSAQVFAYDVSSGKVLWRRTLPGEGEVTSPVLVGSYLYVSAANGVVRLVAADGRPNGTYRFYSTRYAAGYRTTRIAYHSPTNTIVHAAGGQLRALQISTGKTWSLAEGNYSYPTIGRDGRLFVIYNGRDIRELRISVPAA